MSLSLSKPKPKEDATDQGALWFFDWKRRLSQGGAWCLAAEGCRSQTFCFLDFQHPGHCQGCLWHTGGCLLRSIHPCDQESSFFQILTYSYKSCENPLVHENLQKECNIKPWGYGPLGPLSLWDDHGEDSPGKPADQEFVLGKLPCQEDWYPKM